MQSNSDFISSFRFALTGLAIAWLLPASVLINRASSHPGRVLYFGRYDLDYFALLIAYVLAALMMVGLALAAPPKHVMIFGKTIKWFRSRIWLVILLVYLYIEAWYAFRRLILQTGFFFGNAYRLVIGSALLVGVVVVAAFLFSGRTAATRNSLLAKMLTAGVAGALSFIAAAYIIVTFNVNDAGDLVYTWGGTLRFHWGLGFVGRPNLKNYRALLTGATYNLDDDGFRNSGDIAGAPIAMVGDSFVFGLQLSDRETLTSNLSKLLGVQVANYSAPGYSGYHYNYLLENYVIPRAHNVVIYTIYENDIIDDSRLDEDIGSRFINNGIGLYLSPLTYAWWLLTDQSPAYRFIRFYEEMQSRVSAPGTTCESCASASTQGEFDVRQPDVVAASNRASSRLAVQASFEYYPTAVDNLLRRTDVAIKMVSSHDLNLVVVLIPSINSASTYTAEPGSTIFAERAVYSRVCGYVRDQQVECLDLTDSMRQSTRVGHQLYIPGDGHLDENGTRFVSAQIAKILRSRFQAVLP